jgi:hypothetical protein
MDGVPGLRRRVSEDMPIPPSQRRQKWPHAFASLIHSTLSCTAAEHLARYKVLQSTFPTEIIVDAKKTGALCCHSEPRLSEVGCELRQTLRQGFVCL